MTSIKDKIVVTIKEFPEDPWGRLEGTVFIASGRWKEGAEYAYDESSIPQYVCGRGSSREEALADARATLMEAEAAVEERRRHQRLSESFVSVEEVSL